MNTQPRTYRLTHATPETHDTWRALAAKTMPALEGQPLCLGHAVQEGGEGAYAARRIYWRSGDGWSSALLVARDEGTADTPHATRLEGLAWWPYTCHGCYACGPDCDRHGDDHPSHQVSA